MILVFVYVISRRGNKSVAVREGNDRDILVLLPTTVHVPVHQPTLNLILQTLSPILVGHSNETKKFAF